MTKRLGVLLALSIAPLHSVTAACITTTYEMSLYSIEGTWQGSENTVTNWSLLFATTTINSAGPGAATYADFDNFWFSANSSTGLYITLTSNLDTGVMYYSQGTAVGNTWAANSDLQLLEGIGIEYAFGTAYSPRGWNGAVYYEMSASEVPVPAAAWLFASGLIGLTGFARRQQKNR